MNLLKQAKKRYPKGTRFISPISGKQFVSTGKMSYTFFDNCIMDEGNAVGPYVCEDLKWAEIIKPKETMTKEEALKKIEELKKFIEVEEVKVTQWPSEADDQGRVNGYWAFSVDPNDKEGLLFLTNAWGTWTNERGEKVKGYFNYTP